MWPHTRTDATVVHLDNDLEHTIYLADSMFAKAIGVSGRPGVPAGSILVFPCDRVGKRSVHMVGVRSPIRVWWVRDNTIERTELLRPWTGFAVARADHILELPAVAPAGDVGDRVAIQS